MRPESTDDLPEVPRLFLLETGWQIVRKPGSEREFCYMVAPGQDYYHRLLEGEIFLHRADEKICLPCAARRGLLSFDPKTLREPIARLELAVDELFEGFDVVVRDEEV